MWIQTQRVDRYLAAKHYGTITHITDEVGPRTRPIDGDPDRETFIISNTSM